MKFDLKHLYALAIVNVTDVQGNILFTANVREISHGEKTEAQSKMMAEVEIPIDGSPASRKRQLKKSMKQALANGVSTRISLYEELAAIDSWTLQDGDGNDVPVCAEAWQGLPSGLAKQIVEAIERLNPELDDEFPDDDADESTDE